VPEAAGAPVAGIEFLDDAEPDLLDRDELEWLNAYHARVRDELMPLVEDKEDRD